LQVGDGVGVGLGDELPPPFPPRGLGLELGDFDFGALDLGEVGFGDDGAVDLGAVDLGACDFGPDERGCEDFGACEPPDPDFVPCFEPPTAVGAPGFTAIGAPAVIGGSDPFRIPTGMPVTVSPLR
jgi:hypothetical protein